MSFFRAIFLSFFRQTFLPIVFLKNNGRAIFTKKNRGTEYHGNHRTKHSQMHVTPCREGNLHTKESQDPEQRQRQRRRFLMSETRNSKMNAREESSEHYGTDLSKMRQKLLLHGEILCLYTSLPSRISLNSYLVSISRKLKET